jgi:hypothetical protein
LTKESLLNRIRKIEKRLNMEQDKEKLWTEIAEEKNVQRLIYWME